jgi:tRNA (guanine37-N1)-methyltransferase
VVIEDMRFDVVTLFPEMFAAVTDHGITRRANRDGLWSLATWNPRDFADDVHRSVDDRPYGGGPGMVMLAEPLARAVSAAREVAGAGSRVLAMAAAGIALDDSAVRSIAEARTPLIVICGRYEGIDQRFLDTCVDAVVSIGDFVLSGGEIAAMALIDAVVRRLPGALKDESVADESYATGLLDATHYTRPELWRGIEVPEVLRSGHHAEIARWRRRRSLLATARLRPALIERARAEGRLAPGDEEFLRENAQQGAAPGQHARVAA